MKKSLRVEVWRREKLLKDKALRWRYGAVGAYTKIVQGEIK